MIGMNIASLRKSYQMTQEELAEKLNVSRQTLAKWEREESEPDLQSMMRMSELFHVSIDDLIHYDKEEHMGIEIPPKGKHFFGSVTVGERGQIVIPQKARKVFHIEPGDHLLIFGDEERGLAVVPKTGVVALMKLAFGDKED
ncbi:MAG: helix-turn-helix domain-containing protein [Lachnospiraceae bacterium]|nr:helix-turn-helix domain-containing protein [Lachnospiraceae bacterium]